MKYVFYPDIFWVTNFVLDMLVLVLTRRLKKSRSSFFRILIASASGATGTLILFLGLSNYMWYQLLIHFLLNPAMIFIAFPVKSGKGFCKDFMITYLMVFLIGGILNWGVSTLGQWKYFWIWAIGGFGICMLVIHWLEMKKLSGQEYEILLLLEDRNLMLCGFLDTGNLLRDPMLNQPVHIIQEDLIKDEIAKNKLFIRYIPYHSLGQEKGMIPVVTLKAMYIKGTGEKLKSPPIYLEKPVFGLAKEKLFQEKKYQVILNAQTITV